MLLITSNKSKQLLVIHFIGNVRPKDIQIAREEIITELDGLSPRFHYLANFTHLDVMGLDCEFEIGHIMDLIGKAGVGLVVRVIPDPSKDIGLNILTIFHYPRDLRVVTCENLTDAVKALGF
jgi:hypothetical protein